jgi:hypothetical protein
VICTGYLILVEQRNLGIFHGLGMFREARNVYRITVEKECEEDQKDGRIILRWIL